MGNSRIICATRFSKWLYEALELVRPGIYRNCGVGAIADVAVSSSDCLSSRDNRSVKKIDLEQPGEAEVFGALAISRKKRPVEIAALLRLSLQVKHGSFPNSLIQS